jgi:hypothetical protein
VHNLYVLKVSQLIRAELAKTYNPDSIPIGELSEDTKKGLAEAKASRQQAAVQANGNTQSAPQRREFKVWRDLLRRNSVNDCLFVCSSR